MRLTDSTEVIRLAYRGPHFLDHDLPESVRIKNGLSAPSSV